MVNPVPIRPPYPPVDEGWRRHSRLPQGAADLLALFGFLGLSALLFAGVWRAPTSSVAGTGTEDIGIIVWFLRWVPFALGHAQNPLTTTYLNSPHGVNSMWNASMPVAGVAMWPFTASLGPIFSYNLLVTLAVGLSAWCAFLAARRYVASPVAAALGGLLYGFSPYMIAQSQGHLHVTLAFIPPLMLLAFDEIVVRQQRSARWMGVLLGLLAACQLLLAEELLATEALTAMLGIALLITLYPQRWGAHRRHALAALGVAAAVFLVLAAAPIGFQFFGPQHVTGAVQIRNAYVSDLLGFVVPTAHQQFAPPAAVQLSAAFSGYSSEWDAYLGLPLIAVLIYVSVRFWARPPVRVASTLLLVLAILSLGTTLHIAGQWTVLPVGALALTAPLLRRVIPVRFGLYVFPATWVGLVAAPILSSALPARLMLYVFLFAGLLLAVFADTILRTTPSVPLKALLIGAALLPLTPHIPFPAAPVEVPTFFTGSGVRQIPQGSVALVLPYARLANSSAMLWQAASDMRFRMPESYALLPGPSFSSPPTATGFLMRAIELGDQPPAPTDDLRRQVLGDLRAWDVRTILVGPMPYRQRMIAFFSWLTGTAPQENGGVSIWMLGAGS
ncbi:MAG: hypothetical protein M3Z28_08145 [Candidatus Dormibacteraeota bacterium]|nr:hypothetical protein [Candidatus Dormibacteraeota bacterium]